jgi:hypothetical protein
LSAQEGGMTASNFRRAPQPDELSRRALQQSRWRHFGVVLIALAVSACSESTIIRTNPPGASVYVNERYLGASPAEFTAKSWSVKPHVYRYRVAKAGYLESEGEVPAHLSVGRIIAAYFSACASCGHGFFEFDDDVVVRLQPE